MNIDKIDKEEKFEKDLKEMFRKEMVLDDESEIYKELAENGKITEFENLFVDEIYDSFIKEVKKDKLRHFYFTSIKHMVETVFMTVQTLAINLLATAEIALPLVPSILQFVKTDNPMHLLKPLAANRGLSQKTKQLLFSFVNDLTRWKERTWCSSIFIVWGAII